MGGDIGADPMGSGSGPHKNLVVGILYGSDPTKISLKLI